MDYNTFQQVGRNISGATFNPQQVQGLNFQNNQNRYNELLMKMDQQNSSIQTYNANIASKQQYLNNLEMLNKSNSQSYNQYYQNQLAGNGTLKFKPPANKAYRADPLDYEESPRLPHASPNYAYDIMGGNLDGIREKRSLHVPRKLDPLQQQLEFLELDSRDRDPKNDMRMNQIHDQIRNQNQVINQLLEALNNKEKQKFRQRDFEEDRQFRQKKFDEEETQGQLFEEIKRLRRKVDDLKALQSKPQAPIIPPFQLPYMQPSMYPPYPYPYPQQYPYPGVQPPMPPQYPYYPPQQPSYQQSQNYSFNAGNDRRREDYQPYDDKPNKKHKRQPQRNATNSAQPYRQEPPQRQESEKQLQKQQLATRKAQPQASQASLQTQQDAPIEKRITTEEDQQEFIMEYQAPQPPQDQVVNKRQSVRDKNIQQVQQVAPKPTSKNTKPQISEEKKKFLRKKFRVLVMGTIFGYYFPIYLRKKFQREKIEFESQRGQLENVLLNENKAWLNEFRKLFLEKIKISFWQSDFAILEMEKYTQANSDPQLISVMTILKFIIEILKQTAQSLTQDHIKCVCSFTTPGMPFLRDFFSEFVTLRLTPNLYGKISHRTDQRQIEMMVIENFYLMGLLGPLFVLNDWYKQIEKIDKGILKLKTLLSYLHDFYFQYFNDIPIQEDPSSFEHHNTNAVQYRGEAKTWKDNKVNVPIDSTNHTRDKVYFGLYTHDQLYTKIRDNSGTSNLNKVVFQMFGDWVKLISDQVMRVVKERKVQDVNNLYESVKQYWDSSELDEWKSNQFVGKNL